MLSNERLRAGTASLSNAKNISDAVICSTAGANLKFKQEKKKFKERIRQLEEENETLQETVRSLKEMNKELLLASAPKAP